MNRRAFHISLNLIVLCTSLHSQTVIFKTYTVNDGIVANPIRKVLQDSKGFLWIATWEGLSKYDGNKFTNYSTSNGLSFDLVNDLYEDSAGKIYLAENNGSLDIIDHNHISRDSVHRDVVVNNFFRAPQDQVLAATDDKGLLRFNKSKWDIPSHQQFTTIIDFAALNDSLSVIINTDLKPCVVDRNINSYSASTPIPFITSAIRRDSKNRLWLCTSNGLKLISALQHKGKAIAFDSLPRLFEHPALRNQVTDLFEDIDGNYWISTLNGLVRLDRYGRLQVFTTSNGLPTNIVNNFYQDRERNIWMCSQAGLVKMVMKNNLQYFGRADGLITDEVLAIFNVGQDVCLNNANHLLKLNPERNGIIPAADLSWTSVCNASDDHGNCFVGTGKGLVVRAGLKTTQVPGITFRITAVTFDDLGHLWIGTWNNGLFCIALTYSNNTYSYQSIDVSKLVPDQSIRSIFRDKGGNIWVGTRYKGVTRIGGNPSKGYRKMDFDRKSGMNSNWVKAIAEDENGNMWIGTLQGLNKLIPINDSFRIFDFSRINHSYGPVNCIYTGIKREIWYGGPSGLVRFRDDDLDTLRAPDVFLTTVQSATQLALDDKSTNTISLPYSNNQINFEFSAPSFINEKEILYSYRLRGGSDTSWSNPANLHSVSFASLSPGKYRYEVRAIGWDGQPGSVTSFSFVVENPFWQTWWFYLLVALFTLSIAYILYRYRINQMVKVQLVRDRIATDLHDDIGSSLTNINILSELSYQNISQPEHAQRFLQRISEEVGNTSQAMDDIIWNVNSRNDSVQETLERMRRFAAELFDHSAVIYHLELDDAMKGKKMNMEQRRDVFLMYKEMLNNVHKHSGAGHVWIEVKVIGNILHLRIKDDGNGFDTGAVTQRNGLKNLYQRSARWAGSLRIRSVRDEGTDIHISLPLSG